MIDTLSSTDDLYPGYAEAVARENLIRGAACLGWDETVCGCAVRPLTPYHIRRLTYARSPFLARLKAEELCQDETHHAALLHHAMIFLWTISPMFSEAGVGTARPRKWWPRRQTPRDRFNQSFSDIMQLTILEVSRELLNYVDEAYIDSEDAGPSADTTQHCAFEIQIAQELHKNYPRAYRIDFWNPDCPRGENPVHVPLKIIFQLRKARLKAAGETVSNRSDLVKSEGLAALGKKLRERATN